jgi:plastocyanin
MQALDKNRVLRGCAQVGIAWLLVGRAVASAQQGPVVVQVEVVRQNTGKPLPAGGAQDRSNVAVWFTPLGDSHLPNENSAASSRTPPVRQNVQLVQRNKSFDPHVLMIQAGSTVQFPNKDPFFHNVFSLFDGRRFDLGLYEGGSSNSARFDRPGVSFLFCNIHPEMSAVVVVVDTPYFALSDHTGRVVVANVPDGRYLMHVWYERSAAEDLKALERAVTISDSTRSLESLQIIDTGDFKLAHKNKYGLDYTPQRNPAYKRP